MDHLIKNSKSYFFSFLILALCVVMTQTRLLHAEEAQGVSDSVKLEELDTSSASVSTNDSDGNEFSDGFKKVGRGIKQGALVTGRAFKKAGSAIKNYFAGTSSQSREEVIQERDLSSGNQEDANASSVSQTNYNADLDRVGNSPVGNQSSYDAGLESDAHL